MSTNAGTPLEPCHLDMQVQYPPGAPVAELPKYQSHKVVWALKIKALARNPNSGDWHIEPEEAYALVPVTDQYMLKHEPVAGGYYVVYEDGYKSFSPAEAFESGYTRMEV
jgi:hypothetical protein